MPYPQAAYQKLKPEIRFMCRFLSEANFEDKTLFLQVKPDILLDVLKQHKLYPPFYKKWIQSEWKDLPEWNDFTVKLKKLVDRNRFQMMRKTAVLIKIGHRLQANDISFIALKGPALAQRLYGDITMRVSSDLDILVKQQDIFKAAEILELEGFSDKYLRKDFTPRQNKFFFRYYRHSTFTNQENTVLDLHWQLNYLLPDENFMNDDFWERKEYVILGGVKIPVLNGKEEFESLVMHGLSHSFHCLQWLYELENYRRILERRKVNYSDHFNVKYREAAHACATLFFRQGSSFISGRYLRNVIRYVNTTGQSRFIRSWRDAYGRMLLTGLFTAKLSVFKPRMTSPKDWVILKLPNHLFWLYFLLRPLLSLKRVIANKKER